ncbi:MAG: hypothetical protein ABSH01_06840 [Terriglobia bacterium]|jgi:hypothetical protein
MLARRREQILIIVGLVGLNILLGWFLGRLWKDYRSRTQWLYSGAPAQPPATPAARLNLAAQPQSFVEIVDRSVFSPQRGRPQSQSQEEAKAPKEPFLFGTMNLGNGWFALMAPGDQPSPVSKRVLPGEEIGGYKLVSIGASNVVIEWQEKKITLDISESARRIPGNVEKTASGSTRFAPVSTSGSSTPTTVRPTAPVSVAGSSHPVDQGGPPGASPDAPPGTVVGGKRKVVVPTPFGTFVQWEDVRPAGSQAPQQTGSPNN